MEKKKKTHSRISTWFRRMFFGPGRELSFLEEEQVQSPLRSMAKRFFTNKIAMTGLIVFLSCLLLVIIGPIFLPLDLSYSDATQQNVPPTRKLAAVPEALKSDLKKLSVGTTYGIGCDNAGQVYTWGYTKITDKIDLAEIPDEVREAKIVDVAAGYDHVLALSDKGRLYVWGNTRLSQADIPQKAQKKDIILIGASTQYSAALTKEGYLYLWGNGNTADIKVKKDYQNHIAKFALSDYAYVCLMDDGSIQYTGYNATTSYAQIPEGLESGVIDIAASSTTFAAVTDDGEVAVWGNVTNGENEVPEFDGEIREIYGGRYHYTALLDTGKIISWGDNHFGQAKVPDHLAEGKEQIKDIYTGYYQNYAVNEDGKIFTWGLKGYLMGTDNLGRDVLTRLVNGGRVTMTVGAVSVIIMLLIGITIGGLSGYFGGRLDVVLMRIAEVISGIPFLPFALILSSVVSSSVSLTQRMYLIMVVLGILSWPPLARLVRAQILAVREQEYVMAAKAMGVKELTIVFKHILPNILSVVLVNITLDFATCMLTESSLSYLGFGIIPPTPTWGNMLTGANNSVVIQQYWWRWVFPALIFGICTIAINLMGDGLRDAVDPKSEER
ncbi:peptide/nickel transport system permease protein [Hungatella effluvii]|uniref:Peptide/nickel transport system permease protein n=1 Tax=Hungatella effluvii TaxID=1096246 RepID=A0A2V3XXI8_9FIRM|nr:ABC transporter permease subunit [Hungatella effluvii]PXX45567.1 peptide/nickel transport system permease protein [Hungatella effluvii]